MKEYYCQYQSLKRLPPKSHFQKDAASIQNLPSIKDFSNYDRRLSSHRQNLIQTSRVPAFLKKTQYSRKLQENNLRYFETSKSLIVKPIKNEQGLPKPSNKGNEFPSSQTFFSELNQKTQLKNSTKFANRKYEVPFYKFQKYFENKKEKEIRNYNEKVFSINSTNCIKNTIFEDLRQTQDTINNSPKKTSKPSTPKVQDFIKLKLLGKGKNGEVYLSIHKKTGFACALKIIKKKDINRGSQSERQTIHQQLLRQIKIQLHISHPNVVELYGVFSDRQNIYLIQQLGLNGQLYQIMKKKEKFSQESTALISRQILKGISGLHSRNIIHRDIKPENIVLVYGIAKLCDFGWSVYCPLQLRSTLCGTPLYLSPEILVGEEYDQKIDIWAFGTLVFQLFTGENPFKIKQKNDLKRIITDEVIFNVCFPRRLKKFLEIILKKNAYQRPSASQILTLEFLEKYKQLQTSEEVATL